MLGKVIPRPVVELHPREIRQLLNPFKQSAYQLGMTTSISLHRRPGCKGYFWDSKKMRLVEVFLGDVFIKPIFSYHVASSLAVSIFGESAKFLSREEGATPSEKFSPGEYRAERSEHGTQQGENRPGPYVIPGQSPTGWTKHQNSPFEWSLEKCEAESC